MAGQANWAAIIWIAGLAGGSALFGFLVAWRISIIRSSDKVVFDSALAGMEQRVRLLETQNASTLVILEHMGEFRKEVSSRIDQLMEERRGDMRSIQQQLNQLANFDRMNRIAMETRDAERRD